MPGKYAKDYQYKDVTDENGKASSKLVYTGTYYRSDLPETVLRIFRRHALTASAASLLFLCIGGLVSSGAGRDFRVMIPWLILLLCLIYFLRGTIRLFTNPSRMTRHQYEDSFGRTARSSLLAAFFSVITFVMDLVFLFSSKDHVKFPGDLLFLISMLLILVTTVLFFYRNRDALNSAQPEN